MKFCCVGFKSAFENAGRRGFAMLVVLKDKPISMRFLMQHRTFDVAAALPLGFSLPVLGTIVGQTAIVYCPWCGISLAKHYEKYRDDLIGLRHNELEVRAT